MFAQWTADLIGKMHLHSITVKQLADKIVWNSKYLSTVLNSHRTPKNAEQALVKAMTELI